ncbi:hypothetical protein PG999_014348 [Apiospora kogelbergensis]|uniref:PemK-like, MazF-like toxin of type II toxin-antitoxin system n=1 Tax=Apiospora kogelbergensis TaxID=1337665 RepID=A0AAW0QB66_9PEZI
MPGIRVEAGPIRAHRAQERYESSRPVDTMASAHLPGLILWLPKKDPSHELIPGIDEGAYNHPVVVLSAFAQGGKVIVLPLTSFNETDLLERYRESPRKRKSYLPIDPANAHPDNGKLLRLKNPSLLLWKKSYINTKTKHMLSLEILRPYKRNADFVLSKTSYQELIEYCGFQQPLPSPVPERIPPTFERIPTPCALAHHQSSAGARATRSDTRLHGLTESYPIFLGQGRVHYRTDYGTVPANHHPGYPSRTAQRYSMPDYGASRVGHSNWQSDAHTRSNMAFQGHVDTDDPGCPVNIGVVIFVVAILFVLCIFDR